MTKNECVVHDFELCGTILTRTATIDNETRVKATSDNLKGNRKKARIVGGNSFFGEL